MLRVTIGNMTGQMCCNNVAYMSSSACGTTRVSPVTAMKFVSPSQRGTMWMWT